MKPLRVLVADDESMARQRLTRLLGSMPDVTLLGACEDGPQVLERLRQTPADVLILDIQMPGLTGLEAAQMLPEPRPYLIFCTAHREHALEAFDTGAVDYLLKPVEAGRLRQALERAGDRLRPATPALARLPVQTRAGIRLLAPGELTHAVLDGELVTLFTASNEKLLVDQTLQELEEALAPHGFERVHRRALLHLDRVVRLTPLETGGFTAHFTTGTSVEISRQVGRELRRRLGLRKAREDDSAD